MNRYKILKELGDGTYGTVVKAVNKQTGEVVCAASATQCANSTGTGGNQKNEAEILYLGGMYRTTGG